MESAVFMKLFDENDSLQAVIESVPLGRKKKMMSSEGVSAKENRFTKRRWKQLLHIVNLS